MQDKSDFSQVESIAMDMLDLLIKAVVSYFERSEELIPFDRFHAAGHFGKALNRVRASEHREAVT